MKQLENDHVQKGFSVVNLSVLVMGRWVSLVKFVHHYFAGANVLRVFTNAVDHV